MSLPSVFFLRTAVLLFLILVLVPHTTMSGENLVRTPGDSEGPFYPLVRQPDEDNDLIHVTGHARAAKGNILYLSGKVVNTEGQPMKDVEVEIWQTDPRGLYNDPRDSSPGERDPDFQYWGKTEARADGSFSFITLVPGKYEPRPPHIHFKVWINDTAVLTSQMYLKNLPGDDSLLRTDPLQTIELKKKGDGTYTAFMRIVL